MDQRQMLSQGKKWEIQVFHPTRFGPILRTILDSNLHSQSIDLVFESLFPDQCPPSFRTDPVVPSLEGKD